MHAVAGFFALGVLINLGPRIGKFNRRRISANHIGAHNLPFTLTGLMLIIVGFWGFLMACVIVPGEAWSWYGDKWANHLRHADDAELVLGLQHPHGLSPAGSSGPGWSPAIRSG